MADLSLLQKELNPEEVQEIKTIDPRFQEIAGLAQDAKFEEAGKAIEALFGENIYDIRLIGYYLAWAFDEGGLPKLKEIIDTVNHLLENNWAAVTPKKRLPRHADKSFSWLLGWLLKALQGHEERQDDTWKKWISQFSREDCEALLESVEKFRRMLLANIEPAPEKTLEQWGKLKEWLESLSRTLVSKEKEEIEEEKQEEEKQEEKQEVSLSQQKGEFGLGTVAVSPALQDLFDRLKAFEILVQQNQMEKAALVAYDISVIIENFDPTHYFPQIFGNYFYLLSRHIDEISPYWEKKDTLHWKVMEKLYQTDLESFIQF